MYVPPKEIEIVFCTTHRHTGCPKYREAKKRLYPETSEGKAIEKPVKHESIPENETLPGFHMGGRAREIMGE